MTGEPAGPMERNASSERRAVVFLLVLAAFTCFFNLGGRTLENKDYVRYPEVAREILERGDWLMLRESGRIYVHKPPLHFWKIALSYLALGVNSFAARLPSAAFAFLGIIATYLFARRALRSVEGALIAAALLASMYGYFWWARRTRIDMEFAVLFSLSLIVFWSGFRSRGGRKALLYAAFWFLTGCAFLDKGPIALVNLLIVVPYGVWSAHFRDAAEKAEGELAGAVFALTSIAFFVPVLAWWTAFTAHPDFDVWRENWEDTEIGRRREPFWYYVPEVVVKLVPATPLVALAAWLFTRRRAATPERPVLAYVLWWAGIYLAALHVTAVKNNRYLLPMFIPLAVASSWALAEARARWPAAYERILRWCDRTLLVVAAGCLAAPLAVQIARKDSLLAALPWSLALAATLYAARRLAPVRAVLPIVSCALLLQTIDIGDTLRNRDSSEGLLVAEALRAERLDPGEMGFHGTGRTRETVGFYFNRTLRYEESWETLMADPAVRAIVTDRASWEKVAGTAGTARAALLPGGRDVLVIKEGP